MSKDIWFVRPSAYKEEDGFIVDVYLRNGEYEVGEYVRVNIGEMPETLRRADPDFVWHVRGAVTEALTKAARAAKLPCGDVGSKVAAYFQRHFPTENPASEAGF